MSTDENLQGIIAELDDAHSLVEHLQERVAALEDENSRQRREFLEFRTSTERALGNSLISQQRRALAARRPPLLPNSVGTLEVELDEEEERPQATPPPQTPPARTSTPLTATPPPPRSLVKIVGGKDKKKCEGNIYRVVRPKGKHFTIIANVNHQGSEIKKANTSLAPVTTPEQ